MYLDAVDLSERFLPSRREPPGPGTVFTEADRRSLWIFQAAQARYTALREPDQSVCLNVKFNAKGTLVDSTSPDYVTEKLLAGVAGSANPPTDWARIKAPRLGIFALFTKQARQTWYWYLSPAKKVEFDKAWGPIIDWHRMTIRRFTNGNSSNTFLLPGAPHYVYIHNEAEVVRWMRKFLGIPLK